MTDDRIALHELLEKGSDATFLREMIGFAANRLMELEIMVCGAGYGERTERRRNHRNGYCNRDWELGQAASNCAFRNCGVTTNSWGPRAASAR